MFRIIIKLQFFIFLFLIVVQNTIAQNKSISNYLSYQKNDTLTLDFKTFTKEDSLNTELQAAWIPWGSYVGSFNGITAYSNGNWEWHPDKKNYVNGTYTGIKWQCVEYVQRYYYQIYGLNIQPYMGNANTFYSNASAAGLEAYPNGGSVAPQVGDIICSNYSYGHVAIVREVGSNYIKVIHQNWSNSTADNSLEMIRSGNTVNPFSSNYTILGWLRKSGSNPPILVYPNTGAEFYKGSNITFDWQDVSGASYYEIWIDNNIGFGSPEVGYNNGQSPNWVNNGILYSSQFTLTVNMQNQLPQNLYYWKVRALDSNQQPITDWSEVRDFTLLDQLNPPSLITPVNDQYFHKGDYCLFDWHAVSGASYYEIWIDNNSGFGSPEIGFNNGQSPNWVNNGITNIDQFLLTYDMQIQLPQNLYYWKVRALNTNQIPITGWSGERFFNLLDQQIPPTLVFPPSESHQTTGFNFQWNSVNQATNYELTLKLPGSSEWIHVETTNNYYPFSPTLTGQHLWTVRAYANNIWTEYASVQAFYIDGLSAPSLVSPSKNSEVNDRQPTFIWDPVPNANYYELQLAEDCFFENKIRDNMSIHETSWKLDNQALESNKYFYWRVRSFNPLGDWSEVWYFTVSENAVPVELTNFEAVIKDNCVTLKWITESESNNYGFEIERKSESVNWLNIGFVAGNGTCNKSTYYSYTDENPIIGESYYRIKQIDTDGSFEYSNIITMNVKLPQTTNLFQNYPNPFNPSTKISYSLSKHGYVNLEIYNTQGKVVQVLINEFQNPGLYSIKFKNKNLPSGVYFYKLQVGNYVQIKNMVLIR
ncbi:MAG: CHAP domain-containing protein [Candidatus Hodarchaeota archaeon]